MVTGDTHISMKTERFLCVCLVVFKWHIQSFQPCELKKGRSYREPLGGPGAYPSRGKYFKICANKIPFPAFWDHSQWEYCAQNYRRTMVGCQNGKNGRETTKRKIVKSLVTQRNGRVSKTGRILSENGRFPAKKGGLESMPIFLIDFRWSIDAIQDNTFLKYLPAFPHPAYLYELIKKT